VGLKEPPPKRMALHEVLQRLILIGVRLPPAVPMIQPAPPRRCGR